ncbi:MAG: D-amino acid dehydrogenase [Gammaproteobacteria bacterium]|nr:D-amino acid dehydrogenase [Gammaproteobacteria bacterium]
MKVLVLGGGVVGVATTYYLAEAGYEVTLIDRNAQAASETSQGNAGLYTPGDSYAWASPEALTMAVKSLYRRDLGIKYKLRLDPRLWAWSWKFLLQCTRARAHRNSLLKLRIAFYSKQCLNALVEATGIDYDGTQGGVIYFSRSPQALASIAGHMKILQDNGLTIEVLDRDALVRIDPGLKACADKIAGGIYSPQDQTGDSCKFARRLAAWCSENRGVQFAWETKILSLETNGTRVSKVITDQGDFDVDAVVLAAGADSPLLSERIGVKLPIYPVKGYSVTVPIRNGDAAPRIGLVDEDNLVAMSRMGDRLRMASTAEFTGYDRSHKPKDFESIFRTAKELFPDGGDYSQPEYWAGLRPMTPSSVPILGRARYDNFYLNVGHGHVGWTMSCGTGKFVADLVAGREPEIDSEGLLF